MRFEYIGGKYTEFRGYVFAFGHPTTIMDKATEEALLKRVDFRRSEDEERKNADERQDAPEGQKALLATPALLDDEILPVTALDKDSCPKCGKVVRQGRYMHVKWCKG